MTSEPLDIAKKQARSEARARLAALDAMARVEASRAIAGRLAEWWRARKADLRVVMVYLPAVSKGAAPAPAGSRWHLEEPDLSDFIDHLLRAGVGAGRGAGTVVAAPRVDWEAGTMRAVEMRFGPDGSGLVEVRRHGVPEPVVVGVNGGSAPRVFAPAEVDVVLVPGVAFDASGGRVGRGAGFYDRWLESGGFGRDGAVGGDGRRRVAIGVAFNVQVLRGVPRGAHDVPMDAIVTERRWIGECP